MKTMRYQVHNADELEVLQMLHEDFAGHIWAKIKKKHNEGVTGWDNENWTIEQIKEMLRKHIDKGDPIDIAIIAMFWWNKTNPTLTTAQQQLEKKHGTPEQFSCAVMNAIGEISMGEAEQAIEKYNAEWYAAGL